MTTRGSSPRTHLRWRARIGRRRLVMRQERTTRRFILYRLKRRLGVLWQMTTTHLRMLHQLPTTQHPGSLSPWERPTTIMGALPQEKRGTGAPVAPNSPAPAAPPAPSGAPIWDAATAHLAASDAGQPNAPPQANTPNAGASGGSKHTGRPRPRTTSSPRWDELRQRAWEETPTATLAPLPPESLKALERPFEEQPTQYLASAAAASTIPIPAPEQSVPTEATDQINVTAPAPALRMTPARVSPVRASPVLRDPRRSGHTPTLWDRETQELPVVRRPGRPDNVFALQQPARSSGRLLVISTTTRAVRPQSRQARLKSLAWLAIRIVLSAGLLAYLVVKTNIHALVAVISQASPVWLALGLGVGVIAVVVSAWQWQILLRGERISLDLLSLTWLYFLGIAFNQLLPSSIGGDVAKIAYVARISRKGVSAASATLMTRIVGLGAMLLITLPVAVGAPLLIANFSRVGWGMAALVALASVVYLVGISILLSTPWLLNRLGVERAVRLPYARKIMDLARSLTAYRHRQTILLLAVFASAVFYAASDLNFYCYGRALGITSPFWFYWIAIPLTSLATLAPISLNGYGIRGASFVALFVLVGESGAAALSLSTTMEVQMLLFAVVGAVVAVALQRRGSLIRETPKTTPLGESAPQANMPIAAAKTPARPAFATMAPGSFEPETPQAAAASVRRAMPTGAPERALADLPAARLASIEPVAPPTSAPGMQATRRLTGWPTPLPPTLEPVDAAMVPDGWSPWPGEAPPARNTAGPAEQRTRDTPIGARTSPMTDLPTAPLVAEEAAEDEQPTRLARPTGRPRTRETAY